MLVKHIEPDILSKLCMVRIAVFDFDGVFTDNMVWTDEKGQEMVRCFRGDAFGLRLLDNAGVKYWVLSSEQNPVVTRRCEKIRCPVRQSVWDKPPVFRQLCQEAGASLDEALYMGNDINDLACLRMSGFPVIVADSHPSLEGRGFYRTRSTGGNGAVREICDLLAEVRGIAPLDFVSHADPEVTGAP